LRKVLLLPKQSDGGRLFGLLPGPGLRCQLYRPRLELKSSKVYPLSLVEQKELDAFLEENLHMGHI